MEEITKTRYLSDSLKMELLDDALDFTFENTGPAFDDTPNNTEEQILEAGFKRLEVKFQTKYEDECTEQKRLWKENCIYDITEDLFHSTLERAYRNFYRK